MVHNYSWIMRSSRGKPSRPLVLHILNPVGQGGLGKGSPSLWKIPTQVKPMSRIIPSPKLAMAVSDGSVSSISSKFDTKNSDHGGRHNLGRVCELL